MNARVHLQRDDDIAVVVIDNPPINAGSAAVRQGLLDALQTLRDDATLKGAVLIGAGTTFVAGSDLREFGQPLADPQLPAVIAAIEQCGKPVVAALHGAALGGGFELALGCDARVAAPGTVLGLPEEGIAPRAFTDEEIVRRALLAIVNEAALVLSEGVAERATDVDVALVNGYGFPRWEGGPVFWARQRGEATLQADLDQLAAQSGPGFVRAATLQALLAD